MTITTGFLSAALLSAHAPGVHHAVFIALEQDPGSLVSTSTMAGKVWLLKSSLTHHYGFVPTDVVTLSADNATRSSILHTIEGLADKSKYGANDDLLIYYVGSRAQSGGDMLLQTSDSSVTGLSADAKGELQKTGLSTKALFEGLKKCACAEVLVVMDGALTGDAALGDEDAKALKESAHDLEWLSIKPAADNPAAFTDSLFGFLEQRKPTTGAGLAQALGLTNATFLASTASPMFKFEPVEAAKE